MKVITGVRHANVEDYEAVGFDTNKPRASYLVAFDPAIGEGRIIYTGAASKLKVKERRALEQSLQKDLDEGEVIRSLQVWIGKQGVTLKVYLKDGDLGYVPVKRHKAVPNNITKFHSAHEIKEILETLVYGEAV